MCLDLIQIASNQALRSSQIVFALQQGGMEWYHSHFVGWDFLPPCLFEGTESSPLIVYLEGQIYMYLIKYVFLYRVVHFYMFCCSLFSKTWNETFSLGYKPTNTIIDKLIIVATKSIQRLQVLTVTNMNLWFKDASNNAQGMGTQIHISKSLLCLVYTLAQISLWFICSLEENGSSVPGAKPVQYRIHAQYHPRGQTIFFASEVDEGSSLSAGSISFTIDNR